MNKTKRIQVPVSPADEKTIKAAAKLYKISAAEWMRRMALKAAKNDLALSTAHAMTPQEALEALIEMDLPIEDLDTMTKQSIKGRLK